MTISPGIIIIIIIIIIVIINVYNDVRRSYSFTALLAHIMSDAFTSLSSASLSYLLHIIRPLLVALMNVGLFCLFSLVCTAKTRDHTRPSLNHAWSSKQ